MEKDDSKITSDINQLLDGFSFDLMEETIAKTKNGDQDEPQTSTGGMYLDEANNYLTVDTNGVVLTYSGHDSDLLIYHSPVNNHLTFQTGAAQSAYVFGSDTITFDIFGHGDNDRFQELEKIEADLKEEARLREEHPVVDDLYQKYRLALALVAEKPCDEYFEERMRAFGGKVDEE